MWRIDMIEAVFPLRHMTWIDNSVSTFDNSGAGEIVVMGDMKQNHTAQSRTNGSKKDNNPNKVH